MSAEPVNNSHLKDFHGPHTGLLHERETLGHFLHQLIRELADHGCEFDADEDSDFAYFDIKLAWELDDLDICVHDGHVVVRMVREEEIEVDSASPYNPSFRVFSPSA